MKTTQDPYKELPPKKSPYEGNWLSRLLFLYMGDAMSLANKRSKEGSSLTGNFPMSNDK